MSIRQLFDRLRLLEQRKTSMTPADFAADLAERQALLALIVEDERARHLYGDVLEACSLQCPHEPLGACAACWRQHQRSETVQAAQSAFFRAFPQPQPPTKGDCQ